MKPQKFVNMVHSHPNRAMLYLYAKSAPIKRWIKKHNGSAIEADDILQDAVIIMYNNIISHKTELTVQPQTYLMSIAKNMWLSQLRKNKNTVLLDHNHLADNNEDDSPNWELSNAIIKELGQKCQDLLKLFYYQKQSMQDIAKQLGFRNDKVAKAMKYKCLDKAKKVYSTMTERGEYEQAK